MKITDYKEYVRTEDIRLGIATEQPFKVCVHRCWGKNLTPLMDEIEASFKVRQYRMGNGVDYGKHELFFWTNCDRTANGGFPDLSYFDVNLNDKTSIDARREVLARLISILTKWDGTRVPRDGMPPTALDSYATIDYHSELIERDALHLKALENMMRIGTKKCEYGGMVGHFFHKPNQTLFRKFRTQQAYYVTDEEAARAKVVA